jgi:hypothetical protein
MCELGLSHPSDLVMAGLHLIWPLERCCSVGGIGGHRRRQVEICSGSRRVKLRNLRHPVYPITTELGGDIGSIVKGHEGPEMFADVFSVVF